MTTCTGCRSGRSGCGSRGGCTNTHMPAMTRQEAAMLPATAAIALENAGYVRTGLGRRTCTTCGGTGWVSCGQTAGSSCTACGQTSCGCSGCNGYGACPRGSAAGMAILYAPGVAMPGVNGLPRGCPWRRNQTAVPVTLPIDQPAMAQTTTVLRP